MSQRKDQKRRIAIRRRRVRPLKMVIQKLDAICPECHCHTGKVVKRTVPIRAGYNVDGTNRWKYDEKPCKSCKQAS